MYNGDSYIMSNKIIKGSFSKVDSDKRVAYGWAYVSKVNGEDVVDHSGDVWDINEVRKTAHEFLLECRVGGEGHVTKGGAELVESIVFTKELQDSIGINLDKEGWFVGFRITDEELLQKVQNGTYSMFSIGGTGTREKIDEEA